MRFEPKEASNRKPDTSDFLAAVEFQDAALLSYVTSGIVFPAYDAIKRDFGLIRGEYLLLLCLSHYPSLTAQDVSRLTGRPRNTISRAVNRMLSEGYLKRGPDPSDGRQANLSITDEGRMLHDRVVKYLVHRQELVLSILKSPERKQLRRIMNKLARHAASLRK